MVGTFAEGVVVRGAGFVDDLGAGDVRGEGGGWGGLREADGCDLAWAFGVGVLVFVFVDVGPGAVVALADEGVCAAFGEVEILCTGKRGRARG